MAAATVLQLAIAIALLLIVFRTANAFILTTFFQPDEYFQSLEPAWQLAFGPDSGAWLTWEWREQLRAAIHPVLFSGPYKAADAIATWLDLSPRLRAELLVAAPKFLQVPIAAAVDFYTWRLATVTSAESKESYVALLLSVWSPWQWYVSTRTFSNTLETLLTVVALSWWSWSWSVPLEKTDQQHQTQGSWTISLAAAALACLLRPTNAIIWIAVISTSIYKYDAAKRITELVSSGLVVGSAVLALSVSVDRAYYGAWAFPQLQFLYMNIIQSIASFYGRNRIDYYFTEGLPLLLTTAIPFAVIGLWQGLAPSLDRSDLKGYQQRQIRFHMAVAAVSTVLMFSCIAHKEVRFIFPILPILHVLAARPILNFFTIYPVQENLLKVGLLCFLLTINMYIMAYTSLLHQQGVIEVMHFLRHEAEGLSTVSNITVGFLMPCHSTPWRSHLVHPQISAWALTCEPPLNVPLEWRDSYEDEADVFYNHPGGWIDNNMVSRESILEDKPFSRAVTQEGRRAWPDYLVHFEHLEPTVNGILDGTRYSEHARFFNTHWHDDWRRRGDVVVQKLNKR